MKKSKGSSNAGNVFQISEIPSDNHIRNILDGVPPESLHPLFDKLFDRMNDEGLLDDFRNFGNELLIVIDGMQYYTSKKIHCDRCSRKKHSDGSVTYYHSLLAPAIVSPKYNKALALAPEFISSQINNKKQDHEINAAKRWLDRIGDKLSPFGVTIMGDDLFSNHPFCEALHDKDLNYILVCKPTSHKWLYGWVAIKEHEKEIHKKKITRNERGKKKTYYYRFGSDLPLRDTDDAIHVNWAEVIIENEKGKQLYKNAFISNHPIHEDNIESFIDAGRARWKIENENNNTLKTKGYHLEYNFGHGNNHLSETLALLNITAFLFHTLLSFVDKRYQLVRNELPRRDMFFQDISALFRYMLFTDWDHLLRHMIEAMELDDPG